MDRNLDRANRLLARIRQGRIRLAELNARLNVARQRNRGTQTLERRARVTANYLHRLRNAYMPMAPVFVDVTQRFTIYWLPTGDVRDNFAVTYTLGPMAPQDVARRVREAAAEVFERIQQGYQAAVQDGGVAGALAKIWAGEDPDRAIIEPRRGVDTMYTVDYETLWAEDPLINFDDVIVNATAPLANGMRSVTGDYGCVVETLHHLCSKVKVNKIARLTKEAILDELTSIVTANETEDDIDLTPVHECPRCDRSGPCAGKCPRCHHSCTNPAHLDLDDETNKFFDEFVNELGLNNEPKNPKPSEPTGFSIGTVLEWFRRHNEYFTVVVKYPLVEAATVYKAENSHKAIHVELFANNNHLYLNEQVELCETPAPRTTIVYEPLDNVEICDRPPTLDDDIKAFVNQHANSPVDVMINIDLDLLVSYFVSNNLAPKPRCDEFGSIYALELPQSTFINSKNYLQRKRLFEEVQKLYPEQYEFQEFNNQSYSKIGMDLFRTVYGTLPQSFDSAYDRELINQYFTTPLIAGFATPTNLANIAHVDLKKAYVNSILQSETHDMPVFHSRDSFTPYNPTEKIPFGECIVDMFSFHEIQVPRQIWNCYTVQRLLKLKLITRKNILAVRPAYAKYPMKPFADFVKMLVEKFPNEKALYASFVGGMGVRKSNRINSELTTDTSFAELFAAEKTNRMRTVAPGIKLIYNVTGEEILENNAPAFRTFLGETTVNLLELAIIIKKLRPNAKFLTARLDSLYYELPSEILDEKTKFFEDAASLKIKLPPVDFKQNFHLIKCPTDPAKRLRVSQGEYEKVYPPRIDFPQTYPKAFGNKLHHGPPGTGKSRHLVELAQQPGNTKATAILCLAVTRQVAGAMRDALAAVKVECVSMSFEKIRVKYNTPQKLKTFLKKFDRVIIDEFSFMGHIHWDFLNQIIVLTGIRVYMFGGSNQIPPVDSRTYDFQCASVKYLFPTYEYIKYDPKSNPRYNEEMNEILEEFLRTSRLPKKVLSRVVSIPKALALPCEYNITYTRAARDIVIERKKKIFPDHDRYIVIKNTATYDNGDIVNMETIKKKEIPASAYRSHLASTCHYSQGLTFELPYTIYQPESYSKQMMYVALSRCRSLDQITIAFEPNKSFCCRPIPSLKDHEYKEEVDDKLREEMITKTVGVIYIIDDAQNRKCYVGKSEQEDPKARFNDHVRNGVVHPDSKCTILYVNLKSESDPLLRDVESKYIRRVSAATANPDSERFQWEVLNIQHNSTTPKKKHKALRAMEKAEAKKQKAEAKKQKPSPHPQEENKVHEPETELTLFNEKLSRFGTAVVSWDGKNYHYRRRIARAPPASFHSPSLTYVIEGVTGWIRANLDPHFE